MEITIDFIKRLKQRILASRYVVAKIANAESLILYYRIGSDIDNEIKSAAWGDKMLDEISTRLQQELPGLRGFSATNLKRMRIFYYAWQHSTLIGSRLSNQLENAKIEISPSLSDQLENSSIGIILCKEKNDNKVEYSFRDFSKPMGVATYKTSDKLPLELQKALPDAETLKKLME